MKQQLFRINAHNVKFVNEFLLTGRLKVIQMVGIGHERSSVPLLVLLLEGEPSDLASLSGLFEANNLLF